MKTMQRTAVGVLALCAWIVGGGQAFGQIRQPRQQGGAFGQRPLFRTIFTRAWTMKLDDAFSTLKLVDVGQATDNKRINLVMLLGGTDVSDYKRKLLVTHWTGGAGGTWQVDETKEFPGAVVDALLLGRFRQDAVQIPLPATPAPTTTPNGKPVKAPKRKPPTPPTTQQVITTEGVYTWRSGHLERLFTAPPNTRLAMIMNAAPDVVVGGQGNQALAYLMGDTEANPYPGNPPTAGDGYVHFGVGTQDYDGAENLKMALGVRYVQSFWNDKDHWMIGIVRPPPQNNTNLNSNTPPPGDRLVVLTPKAGKVDQDFWATKPADMEESWRSDPLPGRILDVRIGDPRSDGKEGILVLTSENNDKERHLYYYRAQQVATTGQ